MIKFLEIIMRLFISGLAVFISANIIPGIFVDGFWVAVVFSIILSILNLFLKPILLLLTLPISAMTLGTFTLVVNTGIIMLAAYLVPGFLIISFWAALFFGIVLFFVNTFFNLIRIK